MIRMPQQDFTGPVTDNGIHLTENNIVGNFDEQHHRHKTNR